MISDKLGDQIKQALKEKDELRVSTLRLLSSALHNQKIANQEDLTEEEEVAVVKRQAKQRQEAIEALRLAQGKLTSQDSSDLETRADKEAKEKEILEEFLPEQMSEADLAKIVDGVIREMAPDPTSLKELRGAGFGRVMGAVMGRVKGQADGKVVGELVKKRLV